MTTPDEAARCPACGAASIPGARYCEACGHELADAESTALAAGGPASEVGEPADVAGAITGPTYGTSSAPPPGCAACHHSEVNPDGYCDNCGTRRPAAANHSEVDLGGLAGVSDIGSRHHHNEDAMGLAALGDVTTAVVCDGVSSSARPDTAATAAAIAATRVFMAALPTIAAPPIIAAPPTIEALETPEAETPEVEAEPATTDDVGTHEVTHGGAMAALHDATAAAQAAAALAAGEDANPNPPSTTFVAAVVTTGAVTVGWVGDSRAYWVPDVGTPGGPSCLTVDDTLAGQLSAAGVAIASDAPNSGALIRWLGADATDTEPHTFTLAPPGPGRVIVCSDGLYRYVSQPDQLANATPAGTPIEVASALVRLALEAGGQDNVTVVVLPYPPEVEVRKHTDAVRLDRPDRDEADRSPH